ncbi:MAG: efflux RND transporter permease subunit [Planctomycetota bacterium]|jgi:multidrug efflux pump subunit AcrB
MSAAPASTATDPKASAATLFFRSPRLLVLFILLIAVAGLSAAQVLPRAEDPELTGRFALIRTALPGAGAERVESQITEEIEEELRTFEEIRSIDSTSLPGLSVIQVELHDSIDDVDRVWTRMRDRVAAVRPLLPASAGAPDVEELTIVAFTKVYAFTFRGEHNPGPLLLSRLGERLSDRLRGVPGTDDVERFGEGVEEVLVTIDPERATAAGLSPAMIARRIAASDAKAPAGALRTEQGDLVIEVAGEVRTLERIKAMPLRHGPDGRTIRVADVASVTKGLQHPAPDGAIVDGLDSVVVAVRMSTSERVDLWSANVDEVIASFESTLPANVQLAEIFDQSGYTESRLSDLVSNLAIGAGLVLLCVLLMMGWRRALVVSAALPLSALAVLAGLNAMDIPIQQMSVTGLIIALGLLIDTAIVMADEVGQHRATGHSLLASIDGAVRELFVPLLGSTLTTVFAFMPIALMPGGAGEFVGSMAVSVIIALVSSLVVSLLVVPALLGHLDRLSANWPKGPTWFEHGIQAPVLARAFQRAIQVLTARPALGILVGLVLPVTGFAVSGQLQEQFFPSADRDQLQVEMRLKPHASLEETELAAHTLRTALLAHPGIESVNVFVGANAPKVYYNMLQGRGDGSRYAQALVQLRSADGVARLASELQNRLDAALPGALIIVRPFEQGPPVPAPIEFRIVGPDLAVLREQGEALRAVVAGTDGVVHARTRLGAGRPKLTFVADEDQASLLGFRNGAIAEELLIRTEGMALTTLTDGTQDLPVRVRAGDEVRGDLARLTDIALPVPGAGSGDGPRWTPLSALGRFELRVELASVIRRNGERVNVVEGYTDPERLASSVLANVQERMIAAGLELPEGYRLELAGEAAERDRAVGALMAQAAVLVVLMLATLVLSFRSFRLAGLIAVVGVLTAGIGMLMLFVGGYPLGFMAIVGTMGLLGVAINDSIVVLTALRADPDARIGDAAAIGRVVTRQSRHVLATTFTTGAGFLPLFLQGGGFWPPVALTIGGGVVGATILALTLIPAAYALLVRQPATATTEARAAAPRAAKQALHGRSSRLGVGTIGA